MNLKDIKRVYFIGIGGIGMSALARYFNEKGAQVSGYDKTETDLTKELTKEGIAIHFTDDFSLLDKDAQLVVYTPAIPATHTELIWYQENNYKLQKRSEVLEAITADLFTIAVAGTHGKTTISTLISFILRESGVDCNAFLGGVSVNYHTNFHSGSERLAVVEADEYDRSFLRLKPDVAVLTSMDADHLDIYGTSKDMEDAYIQFTKNIKPEGKLVVKHGLKRGKELKADHVIHYSLQNEMAESYASDIIQGQGGYHFDMHSQYGSLQRVRLNIGGMHNVENAVAAMTVAQIMNVEGDKIKSAVEKFNGVKRRFEYVVRNERMVYIDDYAHHPTELATLISSAKLLFPNRKCVVAFQPHLYSRTRDLAEGFAASLDLADEVLLLEIYPARELPIVGVSASTIADKMANPNHTILSKDGILEYVERAPLQLFITAGAGDIDQLVNPIKEILQNK